MGSLEKSKSFNSYKFSKTAHYFGYNKNNYHIFFKLNLP